MKPPSDDPRVHPLSLKLTDSEAKKLDEMRGGESKSDFVRRKLFGRA